MYNQLILQHQFRPNMNTVMIAQTSQIKIVPLCQTALSAHGLIRRVILPLGGLLMHFADASLKVAQAQHQTLLHLASSLLLPQKLMVLTSNCMSNILNTGQKRKFLVEPRLVSITITGCISRIHPLLTHPIISNQICSVVQSSLT